MTAAGAAALIIFSGSVAFDGNARLALREIRMNKVKEWHAQHLDRIDRLRAAAAAHQESAELPAITADVDPDVLPQPKDSSDPNYANNLCMEWYFGVPKIAVKSVRKSE